MLRKKPPDTEPSAILVLAKVLDKMFVTVLLCRLSNCGGQWIRVGCCSLWLSALLLQCSLVLQFMNAVLEHDFRCFQGENSNLNQHEHGTRLSEIQNRMFELQGNGEMAKCLYFQVCKHTSTLVQMTPVL